MARNKNDDNIRIYGGEFSSVYSANLGTAFPAGLAEPGAAFDDLGLLGEDGVTMMQKSDTKEVKVHQGGRVARTKILGTVHTFKFICTETTAKTLGLLYSAAKFATAAGVTTITDVEKSKRDERVFIIDEFDEDVHKRVEYTRAEVTEKADISHKAGDETLYEFTVTSYGAIAIKTNDPGVTGAANTPVDPPVDPTPTEPTLALGQAVINGSGEVLGVSMQNPGSGYTAGATVAFSVGDSTTPATGFPVIQNGGIMAVTLTNPGAGYSVPPTVTFSY